MHERMTGFDSDHFLTLHTAYSHSLHMLLTLTIGGYFIRVAPGAWTFFVGPRHWDEPPLHLLIADSLAQIHTLIRACDMVT